MWGQIVPGLRIKLFMTVVLGVIYPLAMTGLSQLVFPHRANGSLIVRGDKVIGSELIGQSFARPEYFQPRPSAAGSGYDATASGGANLGPTSAKLISNTSVRLVHYCVDNDVPYDSSVPLDTFKDASGKIDDAKLAKAFADPNAPLRFRAKTPIPADAVTASASGLDPHISPANAEIQAARVVKARGIPADGVKKLIAELTERADLGLFGEPRVNVLKLNMALDERRPARR